MECALYYSSIFAVENFVGLEITEPDRSNVGIYFSHSTMPRGNSAGSEQQNLDSSRFLLCDACAYLFTQADPLQLFLISGFTLAFLAGRMEGQGSVCVSGWG